MLIEGKRTRLAENDGVFLHTGTGLRMNHVPIMCQIEVNNAKVNFRAGPE